MKYNTLNVGLENGVFKITINRPKVYNALDQGAFDELESVFNIANKDHDVRVAVLTGEGKSFSAGGDMSLLKAISEATPFEIRRIVYDIFKQINKLDQFEKPLIVAINGPAIGIGLGIALLGDFRIASQDAILSMEFVKIGIVPEAGSTYKLQRLVGYGKAMEMVLTGSRITGKEAERIGLVNKSVPPEDLEREVMTLASALCLLPPTAVRLAKNAVKAASLGTFSTAMEYEAALNSICYSTADHREAVRAFMEKRDPKFIGA